MTNIVYSWNVGIVHSLGKGFLTRPPPLRVPRRRRRHFETCNRGHRRERCHASSACRTARLRPRSSRRPDLAKTKRRDGRVNPTFLLGPLGFTLPSKRQSGPGDTSQRCTGRLSGRISSTSPDVPSPSAADGSHSRPRTTRRRALEVRPGPTRLAKTKNVNRSQPERRNRKNKARPGW